MKFFDLEMSGLAGGGDDRGVSYENTQGSILPKCEVTRYTNGTAFFSCLFNRKKGEFLVTYNTNGNNTCPLGVI